MLPEASPGLLGHVVGPETPSKGLYRAVLLLEATVSPTQVEQRLGLTAGCLSSPCDGWKASLIQALHVHKPQRAAGTVTAELRRFKGKRVRTKSNRSNMSPCLMVRRPSFHLEAELFLLGQASRPVWDFHRWSRCSSCPRNDVRRCSTGGLSPL